MSFKNLTLTQLVDICRHFKITNYAKLTHPQLVVALERLFITNSGLRAQLEQLRGCVVPYGRVVTENWVYLILHCLKRHYYVYDDHSICFPQSQKPNILVFVGLRDEKDSGYLSCAFSEPLSSLYSTEDTLIVCGLEGRKSSLFIVEDASHFHRARRRFGTGTQMLSSVAELLIMLKTSLGRVIEEETDLASPVYESESGVSEDSGGKELWVFPPEVTTEEKMMSPDCPMLE